MDWTSSTACLGVLNDGQNGPRPVGASRCPDLTASWRGRVVRGLRSQRIGACVREDQSAPPPAYRTRRVTHADAYGEPFARDGQPRPGVTRAVPEPEHQPRIVTMATATKCSIIPPEPT